MLNIVSNILSNWINNTTFKIKTGCILGLLTPQTMELLGSAEKEVQ